MLALKVKDPFDKYVFCENDDQALDALRLRVAKRFPTADVSYILGDCNEKVSDIGRSIPAFSSKKGALSFCFVDPYDLSVKFSTMRKIAEYFVDFLVLLALHMDANRNLKHYLDHSNRKIDEFLGLPNWREKWSEENSKRQTFPKFLAEAYAKQMKALGYLEVPFHSMKQVRSDVKNLPLYHLALFSRHELAYQYWSEVLRYGTSQGKLDF